jgi:hypothetical protein
MKERYMKLKEDRKDFEDLYMEYIGDFDDTYDKEERTDEQLEHDMEVELVLIGMDFSNCTSDVDIERLERYRRG